MATLIPLGTPAYLTNFATGNAAGDIDDYFEFAEDHDINAKLVRLTVNQIIVELSAVQGPNAVVALDLALWDDVDNPISSAEQNFGVLGAASYEVSVVGGTLTIKKGQAFVNGQRVSLISTLTGVTSSGGSGTRWVAIDANGAVFIMDADSGKSLDIASVAWDGAVFTGSPTHLADVFFDGDSYAEMRNRAAAGASFPAVVYRRVSSRFEFIEQSLSAAAGGASVIVVPPGAVGTPGLIQSDGAGAADTTTGWYRLAADVWAFAVSTVATLHFVAQGILFKLGSKTLPSMSFIGDGDTGIYSPGANRLGISVGDQAAFEVDAVGNYDAILQTRGEATVNNFSLADGTSWIDVVLDTEVRDVGGSFAPSSADITVPTNAAGTWQMHVNVIFDESSLGGTGQFTGQRGVAIQWNGTTKAQVVLQAVSSSHDTAINTMYEGDLSDAHVIRAQAFQNNTDGANPACDINVRVTWRKVA